MGHHLRWYESHDVFLVFYDVGKVWFPVWNVGWHRRSPFSIESFTRETQRIIGVSLPNYLLTLSVNFINDRFYPPLFPSFPTEGTEVFTHECILFPPGFPHRGDLSQDKRTTLTPSPQPFLTTILVVRRVPFLRPYWYEKKKKRKGCSRVERKRIDYVTRVLVPTLMVTIFVPTKDSFFDLMQRFGNTVLRIPRLPRPVRK